MTIAGRPSSEMLHELCEDYSSRLLSFVLGVNAIAKLSFPKTHSASGS